MISVPQEKYDEKYFTENCDGFDCNGELPGRLKSLIKYIDGGYKTILDIGCGRGEIAKNIKDKFVVSLDYSIAAMNIFHSYNTPEKIFIKGNISTGLNLIRSEYFDCIIIADVIEHIYDNELAILTEEASRILRHGGRILIDTPINTSGSELHINIKKTVSEVISIFKDMVLVISEWYKEPEHCHIILKKD